MPTTMPNTAASAQAVTLTENNEEVDKTVIVQLMSADGERTGPPMDVPVLTTPKQLHTLLNKLLNAEEELPYAFFVGGTVEITKTLSKALEGAQESTEGVITITYRPQALFRVRAITRVTASLPGHAEAVLVAAFAPDSSIVATGSGDTTVRLWRAEQQLPLLTLEGHQDWVLALAFSPDARLLASASRDAYIRIWDVAMGKMVGKPLDKHKKWVTAIAWKPYHLDEKSEILISASKDATLRIWNARTGACIRSLGGHTASVTSVRWSGEDVVYSSSQDRTIKVWCPNQGRCIANISAHGHWVNALTLSTDAVLRFGAFDAHNGNTKLTVEQAKQRYVKTRGTTERLVTGSDDFTLMLWEALHNQANASGHVKPKARMTGHQQLVNDVRYSADGAWVASASFDKTIRLWDGRTGRFVATMRGHVAPVYQIVWSADSRLVMSASRDSTCKIWSVATRKLKADLPGHSDEVYTVDWSPDGSRAVSAGKDRLVKLWAH